MQIIIAPAGLGGELRARKAGDFAGLFDFVTNLEDRVKAGKAIASLRTFERVQARSWMFAPVPSLL